MVTSESLAPPAETRRLRNVTNQSTQYQNGVDMHFDWGASQFLTKQFQAGLVGYVYLEVGCDSGSGDRVGCFQSRVVGVGPQLGFIIPLSAMTQGYLNLKSYWEFANQNRPDGRASISPLLGRRGNRIAISGIAIAFGYKCTGPWPATRYSFAIGPGRSSLRHHRSR
jgi:Putative MetA-pathway of phenol degradation